jgi:hypothetical protein
MKYKAKALARVSKALNIKQENYSAVLTCNDYKAFVCTVVANDNKYRKESLSNKVLTTSQETWL